MGRTYGGNRGSHALRRERILVDRGQHSRKVACLLHVPRGVGAYREQCTDVAAKWLQGLCALAVSFPLR